MGNLFVNIPVPAGNGAGAAVDVSAMGKTKSFICGGAFAAAVTLEYATDDAALVWAPLTTFLRSGNLTIDVAAHWVRANVIDYKNGAPNLDVGSDDSGTLFAQLTGDGASIDISTLPVFKTVVASSTFAGNIEVSEDGVSWAQVWSLQDGGGESRVVVGKFARVVGDGQDVWMAGANAGSGAAAAVSLLAIYGNGNNGDYSTAGNELWTAVDPPPGSPTLPGGAGVQAAFFEDLTIGAGHSVTVGGLTSDATKKAVVIFVNGKLTIGADGNINANGGDAGPSLISGAGAPGLGRNAIPGSSDGGDGVMGVLGASAGSNGGASGNQPAFSWVTMNDPAGGKGGASTGVVRAGGFGGQSATVSWPYSLSQAISIASLLYPVGGGNGGGSGGAATNGDISGSSGGGAATLIIFAREIDAPPGSIQAKGGTGGLGFSAEPGVAQNSGGGGGGDGGFILIVTDETTIAGICDVRGGVGGFPSEGGGEQGATGNPGAIVAMNPMLGPIPT